MKQIMLVAGALAALASAQAQTAPIAPKTEKKEIVSEQNASGKAEKMVILIDGDKVTINGVPADDYKGKRRIVVGECMHIDDNLIEIPRHGRMVMSELDREPRALLGVTTEKAEKGVAITNVGEGTAAQKAGLAVGDIITKLEGAGIATPADLQSAVAKAKPGQTVAVEYLRKGKTNTAKATLGKTESEMGFNWRFAEEDVEEAIARAPMPPLPPMAGMRAPMPPDAYPFARISPMRPKYGFSLEDNANGDGVMVTDVEAGSNAETAGLKKDDQITAINGEPVKNVDGMRVQLLAKKDAASHSITVVRNGATQTLTLRVPKVIKRADF
jgi:serine protease Do